MEYYHYILVGVGYVAIVAIIRVFPPLRRLIRRFGIFGVEIEFHSPEDTRSQPTDFPEVSSVAQDAEALWQPSEQPPPLMVRPDVIPEDADKLEFMTDEYVAYFLAQAMINNRDGDSCTINDGSKETNQ